MSNIPDRDRRALVLWKDLRIIVIDTETTGSTDGDRVLSFAAVIVEDGRIIETYNKFYKALCAISPGSQKVHKLTEEFLDRFDPFADSAQELLDKLEPRNASQTVMLAGHHIPFDISRLRAELRRTGHDLPNYRLLDTIKMAAVAEVQGKDNKLGTLLELLHLTNTNPHDALGDAMSTAQALIELVNRGIDDGMTSIGGIAGWSGGRFPIKTAHGVRAAAIGKDTSDEARLDPSQSAAHIARHTVRYRKWDEWVEVLDECQALACPDVPSRAVAAAHSKPDEVLALLRGHLDAHLAQADCSRAQVAVLINALADVLFARADRDLAKRLYRHYAPKLDALDPCDLTDAHRACCRYCAAKQPCPVDTWHHKVARTIAKPRRGDGGKNAWRTAIIDPARPAAGEVGKLRKAGWHQLAGYLAWVVGDDWTGDNDDQARAVWAAAWNKLGLREPRLADALTLPLILTGDITDITTAHTICDDALATRAGSTDEGWLLITARRRQVDAARVRWERAQQKAGKAPIPTADGRRHEARKPRKTHPLRFRIS